MPRSTILLLPSGDQLLDRIIFARSSSVAGLSGTDWFSNTLSRGDRVLVLDCGRFAGLWGENLVFKLADPAHAEALALPGAHLFDPSGRNRPMKEWVAVPVSQSKRWPGLARAAFDYVESAGT